MNRLKFFSAVFTMIAAISMLTACGGGGGGGGITGGYDPYYNAWYDVYGNVCGFGSPSAGCNYYKNGFKIIDVGDPYFSSYNYYLEYGVWSYYDSYGFSSRYTGWAWYSPSGILYDDWGDALNDNETNGHDLESQIATINNNVMKSAGAYFAAKYSLSSSTGLKVAKALNDWSLLGKKRARTEKDIASFTKQIYGIDVNRVAQALKEAQQGNGAMLDDAIDEASTSWSTTPETLKEILKSWYGSQAAAVL